MSWQLLHGGVEVVRRSNDYDDYQEYLEYKRANQDGYGTNNRKPRKRGWVIIIVILVICYLVSGGRNKNSSSTIKAISKTNESSSITQNVDNKRVGFYGEKRVGGKTWHLGRNM